MQTGYVFSDHQGLYLILYFHRTPHVMARFLNATTDQEACAELGKEFAGWFVPAKGHHKVIARSRIKRFDTLVLR